MIAAAVFDFDGVLVDSIDIKGEAFAAVYAEHADKIVEQVRAFHRANGGMPRSAKIAHFERAFVGREPTDELVDAKAAAFAAAVVDQVVAADEMPGASELLDWLADRMPVFVSSGTPHDELVDIVERRGWTDKFTDVFGSPATKADNLRTVARRLDVPVARLVMVGDATTDHDGAIEAGSQFVGFAPAGSPFPDGTTVVSDHAALRRWFAERLR